MTERQLHEIEVAFGLSAQEVLEIILNRNRCLIAVRGAVAEEHLRRQLQQLRATNAIDDSEVIDQDGQPDFKVFYRGRSFLIECKNVEKEKKTKKDVTVDFQRTRNQKNDPGARFYKPEEFDVLAACLWNRTRQWKFAYVSTRDLPRHPKYPDRQSNRVTIPILNGSLSGAWRFSLTDILDRIISSSTGDTGP